MSRGALPPQAAASPQHGAQKACKCPGPLAPPSPVVVMRADPPGCPPLCLGPPRPSNEIQPPCRHTDRSSRAQHTSKQAATTTPRRRCLFVDGLGAAEARPRSRIVYRRQVRRFQVRLYLLHVRGGGLGPAVFVAAVVVVWEDQLRVGAEGKHPPSPQVWKSVCSLCVPRSPFVQAHSMSDRSPAAVCPVCKQPAKALSLLLRGACTNMCGGAYLRCWEGPCRDGAERQGEWRPDPCPSCT